jgi:hypothetical protein
MMMSRGANGRSIHPVTLNLNLNLSMMMKALSAMGQRSWWDKLATRMIVIDVDSALTPETSF